jgi:serine/threonine-protein kinase
VQGTNLREYLQKKGVPDLPLALAIIRQSAQAVAAAGEAGLTHRDIKPENLLITKKGQVKVADFGLAQLPEAQRQNLTAPGVTLGTPMYMSPEQVQGLPVDHRSDLYSLGVTYYHMLAGQPPFRADTAIALALKHLREEAPSLAAKRPDLPRELVSLIEKLMQKSPASRYASAAELLKDLAKVREIVQTANQNGPGSIGGRADSSKVGPLAETMASPEVSEPWRPGAMLLVSAGVGGLILGASLGWMSRTVDMLSTESPAPLSPPALWMCDWEGIPKQATAEAQYRFALTRSPDAEREAAWIAVPGRFPKDTDKSLASYIQLTRLYLRRRDSESLSTLGQAIEEFEKSQSTPREKWLELSKAARTAEFAVLGDSKEVAARLKDVPLDPALAELTLEIASTAKKPGEELAQSLQNYRTKLLASLGLNAVFLESSPPASTPRPGG